MNVTSVEPLRAVVYARVSHDPRGLGRSVREQVSDSLTLCHKEGWVVVKVFDKDNDKGASTYSRSKREDWERAIDYLEQGKADVFVTWEASRAQRDLEVYLKLRGICQRNNVLWCYSGKKFDLSRTDDRFITGLDALLAERESSVTRDRIMRTQRHNAKQGRPHSRVLYGYRRIYDESTKDFIRQEIDEPKAKIYREIAIRFASGDSLSSISKDLHKRGIPSPQGKDKWSLPTLRDMLMNPGYIGKRVYQGRVVGEAQWPALIDEVTFYHCKRKLSDPARRQNRSGAIRHLLSGLARCAVCNGPLRCVLSGPRYSYRCESLHVNMRKEPFEKVISQIVINRLMQPAFTRVFVRDTSEEVMQAMSEAAEKKARLEEFYDQAAQGELSPAGLARIEQTLMAEINEAEQRSMIGAHPLMVEISKTADVEALWEDLTILQKREVVKLLMDIRLMPSQMKGFFDPSRIKITWKGKDNGNDSQLRIDSGPEHDGWSGEPLLGYQNS